jgi:amidophosphoribosyltransferase
LGVDEVRQSIGADSLGYLSKDGMVAATNQQEKQLCTACFTGIYPIELPPEDRLGKNLLEKPVAACEPGPDSELDKIVKAAND